MNRVVLLNADYSFLNIIDWRRAITLMITDKAEALELSDRIIKGAQNQWEFIVPKIVRLLKNVKNIYKSKIPFTHNNVMVRDNHTCQYCGSTKDLTIDHVYPKSRGGNKRSFENCVVACKYCNNKKGDKTLRESGMRLKCHPHHPTVYEFIYKRLKGQIDKNDKTITQYVKI